jgi:integrase
MGYHSRAIVHGFRAMASTALNEMGFRSDVIERQLAHEERDSVRAAYNRAEYLAERRAMIKHWAEWISSLGEVGRVAAMLRALSQ